MILHCKEHREIVRRCKKSRKEFKEPSICKEVKSEGGITMEWISVNDRLPNKEELAKSDNFDFLCCVLVPEKGGTFYKARRIIFFDSLDKEWDCEGIIVTHWMNMPDYPTEE